MARSRFPCAALRLTALAALVASVPGCGGCSTEQTYPPNFSFPARADRLVLKLPDKPAPKPSTAGQRDEEVAALDALGGTTRDPSTLPAESRAELAKSLEAAFGTPAEPKDVSEPLKLTVAHLQEGARLYKRHCSDCHNITGDGRGAKSGPRSARVDSLIRIETVSPFGASTGTSNTPRASSTERHRQPTSW